MAASSPPFLIRSLSAQSSARVIRRRLTQEELIVDCAGLPVNFNYKPLHRSATEGHAGRRAHQAPAEICQEKAPEEDPKAADVPAGLEDLLCSLGLAEHLKDAEAWCRESGAGFLEEIHENRTDFADALKLTEEERQRFLEMPKESFVAETGRQTVKKQSEFLVRGITVSGHNVIKLAMSPGQVTLDSLDRTCTVPVTTTEQGVAQKHVSAAYVPLKAWQAVIAKPTRQAAPVAQVLPSTCPLLGPDENPQSRRQKIRSSGHFYRMRDWTPPRSRITDPETWRAIRHRIPSASEINALADAQKRLADPASTAPAASQEVAREVPSLSSSSNFQHLQHNFMDKYGKEIRNEIPGIKLQPADVAAKVQNRFMSSLQSSPANVTVQAAYHGTKERNITPILSTGLRIPGNGGVSVANGSAHGIGIYTAKLGASSLSKSFCDSDSFLVCAVADDATPPDNKASAAQPVPSQTAPKWTGSGLCGSRHHRVTQKSGTQTASSSTQAPTQMLGNHMIHKESSNVRHVGEAMVVFDEARVTPLFVAKNIGVAASGGVQGYSNRDWMSGNQNLRGVLQGGGFQTGRQQVVVGDEAMWAPPEAYDHTCAKELRRRIESKQRDVKRQACRDAQSQMTGLADRDQ